MLRLYVSPSADRRLHAARRFIEDHAPATELLVIGANRESVDDLVREVARRRGATFGLHRFSYMQLASRLASAELAARGLVPATPLGVEAVAARVTFEARRAARIPHLDAVSATPGFPRTLAATLAELRAEGISPEALGSRDLATLLAGFEAEIASAGIADRALLLRLAIEGLSARRDDALRLAPVLLLDIATPSSLDVDLVRELTRGARAAFATLPEGDRETLDAIRELEHEAAGDDGESTSGEPVPVLGRLQRFLFADEAPPAGETPGEALDFFSAPGEARECIEIARYVLDAARSGVPFDEIAVFLRAPELYSGLLQTAFRRAEIPAYFARGTRRPDPTGRAFLALLACRAEGLSARRFAEYLSFAQVPDLDEEGAPPVNRSLWVGPDEETLGAAADAVQLMFAFGTETPAESDEPHETDPARAAELPAVEGALRTPWKWEELLVEAAVIGGRDRWRRRLIGLERELRMKIEETALEDPGSPRLPALSRDLANLGHLERFALPIIDALHALPADAEWGSWLRALVGLAPMVLRRPERVLGILAELEPMSAIGPVAIDEVRAVLTERLCTLEQERPAYRYGRVFVATPDQARGRRFRIVFVPGLAERIFPQHPREDPLLLDGVRRDLSPALRTQETRGVRERLLLRLAVGAASERVHLSYPRVDVVEARPRVPSFYALDVARAARGVIPDFEELEREAAGLAEARLAWPAPPDADRAIDPVEHDLAVLGPLLRSVEPDPVRGRARYLLQLNDHLARSLRSRWMRWQKRWYPADGIIRRTEAVEAALAGQRPNERVYSVTALQKYATCPYQFYLSAICRLEPRAEAIALVELDPLTRGRIYHHVQAETLRALSRAGELPIRGERVDYASATLDETLNRLVARYQDDLAPAILRVWEDEIESMRADLRTWLRAMATDPGGWEPVHFELSFGLPVDEGSDPGSRPDPVTLPGGWKLHGAVDLIERKPGGTLRVTDHKTGANHTSPGLVVGGGEVLQPVLYSLAVETALERPVAEARLYFATSRGGFSDRVVPINDLTRRYGIEVLEIIDRAIGEAALPPAPRAKACGWCDFRPICGPAEERRTADKDRKLIADLNELRSLP